MAREVLEVSIFWAGELLSVKQLPTSRRGTLDELDLPMTGDVVVRTRVCEVTPRKRSPIDLPLGALGVVAMLLHSATIASFTSAPEPSIVTGTRAASSYVVEAEPDAVLESFQPARPRLEPNRECSHLSDYMMVNHLTKMQL